MVRLAASARVAQLIASAVAAGSRWCWHRPRDRLHRQDERISDERDEFLPP